MYGIEINWIYILAFSRLVGFIANKYINLVIEHLKHIWVYIRKIGPVSFTFIHLVDAFIQSHL